MIKPLLFKAALLMIVFLGLGSFAVQLLFPVCNYSFEVKAKSDISILSQAIEMYKYDNGDYPDTLELLSKDYLAFLPKDPWGNQYSYTNNSQKVILHTSGDPSKNEPITHVTYKEI